MRTRAIRTLLWLLMTIVSFELSANKRIWEPEFYRENSAMQHRWAHLLMEKSPLPLNGLILDVGCGDGHITALLAQQRPDAQVVGLDLSPSMIQYARATFNKAQLPTLSFIVGDAEKLTYENQLISLVSFSTFHRLANPKKAIIGSFRALLPGGHFLAVFPAKMSLLLTACISVIDSKPKWRRYFNELDRKSYSLSADHFKEMMIESGFTHIRAELIEDTEIFPIDILSGMNAGRFLVLGSECYFG